MHALKSLLPLVLTTTFLQSVASHSTPAVHRAAWTVASASPGPAADTGSIRLTQDLLRRMAAFMAYMEKHRAHLRALMADSANYVHVPRPIGQFQGRPLRLGVGTTDTLLDFGALAAKDPIVAAAFKHAHLAPAQYLPFVSALQSAAATDLVQIILLENRDTPVWPVDSTTVLWKNVTFLRAHRPAIDALSLPLPSVEPTALRPLGRMFLDTTQHPARIPELFDEGRARPGRGSGEPWPWGYMDSTEAPGGRAVAPPLRVLFMGNSLTYVNSMPRIFSRLAAQGLHRRVVVGLVSLSAAPPYLLWFKTDARQILATFPWDAVVVQFRPADKDNPRQTFPYYAQLFASEITAHHARPVFWTESPDPASFASDANAEYGVAWHAMIESTLVASAKAVKAAVAPMPEVRNIVRQQHDSAWRKLCMGARDCHPTLLGAYLDALVIYRTLTGRSPVGLSPTADAFVDSTSGPLKVSAQTAAVLQRAAATGRP